MMNCTTAGGTFAPAAIGTKHVLKETSWCCLLYCLTGFLSLIQGKIPKNHSCTRSGLLNAVKIIF